MQGTDFWICDVGSDFYPPTPHWGPFQTEQEAIDFCGDPSTAAYSCMCQVWRQGELTALFLKNKSIPEELRAPFWKAWWAEREAAYYRHEMGMD